MAIAFFDFDKTLISRNSGSMWLVDEYRRGAVSWTEFVRGGWWLARYTIGFVDLEGVVRLAIKSLAGTTEADLKARVESFYEARLVDLYRPGAKAVLDAHRAAGDQLVLLTSASNYLSEIVQEKLALDGFLANSFEVDENGVFTGEPLGEVCYGAGKLTHAEAYASRAGVRLEDCAFYTDSMADLPVLEVVKTPVAVNPDPRLKRVATAKGWSIQDWGV